MKCRGHASSRQGFVLLTVVVMIAVAVLMLTRVASISMRVAAAAADEEKEMRARWAATSIRRECLTTAPALVGSASPTNQPSESRFSPASAWRDVQIGGNTYRVIVADESSKISLSRLAGRFEADTAQQAIDELALSIRPLKANENLTAASQQASQRWEHWLASNSSNALNSARTIAAATQRLTLWGDGKLNILSADPESTEFLWRELFGRSPPSSLENLRRQSPPPRPSQLISSLGLRESQANLAADWFTSESTCYSVWIFCESDRRVAPSLFVEWGRRGAAKMHRGYEY